MHELGRVFVRFALASYKAKHEENNLLHRREDLLVFPPTAQTGQRDQLESPRIHIRL